MSQQITLSDELLHPRSPDLNGSTTYEKYVANAIKRALVAAAELDESILAKFNKAASALHEAIPERVGFAHALFVDAPGSTMLPKTTCMCILLDSMVTIKL